MSGRLLRPGATWADVEAFEQRADLEDRHERAVRGWFEWFPASDGGTFTLGVDEAGDVWKVTDTADGTDCPVLAELCDNDRLPIVDGPDSVEFPTFTAAYEDLGLDPIGDDL